MIIARKIRIHLISLQAWVGSWSEVDPETAKLKPEVSPSPTWNMLSHFDTLTLTLWVTLSHCLAFPNLRHFESHCHTISLSHCHTISLTVSLSHCLAVTLSLSLSRPPQPERFSNILGRSGSSRYVVKPAAHSPLYLTLLPRIDSGWRSPRCWAKSQIVARCPIYWYRILVLQLDIESTSNYIQSLMS